MQDFVLMYNHKYLTNVYFNLTKDFSKHFSFTKEKMNFFGGIF
jgi:hypothetical protein